MSYDHVVADGHGKKTLSDSFAARGLFVVFTFSVIMAACFLATYVFWYFPIQKFGLEATWRVWLFAISFFACLIAWRTRRGKLIRA